MKLLPLLLFTTLMIAATAFASTPDEIVGSWKTANDSSAVEIFPCGDKLCGKVAWLKHTNYRDSRNGPVGTPKVDSKNPDPALKNRPIIGLQVIEGLTPTVEHAWENGSCYDPESGNSYKCKIHLVAPDKLEVRGFIGISLLGRTYILTRKDKVASIAKTGSTK